jgi:hypothetical protein
VIWNERTGEYWSGDYLGKRAEFTAADFYPGWKRITLPWHGRWIHLNQRELFEPLPDPKIPKHVDTGDFTW